MRPIAMVLAAVLASACQQQEATAADPRPLASASPSPRASVPVADSEVKVETDLYTFGYSYPAAAAGIPALKALLDADREKRKAAFIAFAHEQLASAKADGIDYRKVELAIDWAVVTAIPGWLSLSATIYSYEGGAHPNSAFDALLWDKAAMQRREAADLFTSQTALRNAVQRDFCRAIDKERELRRGAPVDRGSGEFFDQCIDPLETPVILGSSDRKAFNRIGFLVGRYAAGPYVEGDYEATLPVTPAVLAAVKPQYRSAFAAK